uniref:RxLR effector candidate protein n=1 Tax=Hyaloperonospora arabidopsidis (strain Emoy2) TaxID=559515 RepID=M4C1N8_HYAAE
MEFLMLRKVFVIVTAPLAVDVLPTTPKDVWAIGKVDPHVSLELRARVKAFATGIGKKTRIRALATVNAFVATQVARRIKALQAAMVVTRIRFRTRVDPHVPSKSKSSWKLFATMHFRANKDFGMFCGGGGGCGGGCGFLQELERLERCKRWFY